MTNKEAQQMFIKYLNRRYPERSTAQHYRSDIAIFFKTMNDKAVELIERIDIDNFVEAQQAQGLSGATINRRLAALHTFFEFLAEVDASQERPNPVQWQRHSPKQKQPVARDASDAEVDALFAQISEPRDHALFGLMVGAGLRVGEVAHLQCQDLRPPSTAGGMARLLVLGKGGKERVVWLTPQWYAKVAAYQTVRPATIAAELFLNHRGQPLTVNGIQYRLREYCRQARVSLTCHQLRHTFARRLANQQMPIESISKLLGHSQIETTQRYTAGANPTLQAEFEATMTEIDRELSQESTVPRTVPLPRPQRQQLLADSQELDRALARYADFPDWLQAILAAHLRRQWSTWKTNMAASNAQRVSRQVAATWRWFLQHNSLTGWADLTRAQVEAWMDDQQQRGLTAATIERNLSHLRALLFFARDRDLPLHAALFRIRPPKRAAVLPRTLSDDEYQRLLHTVLDQTAQDEAGLLHRTWFLTLAFTGIRLAELLDLRLADLDLTTRRLFIHDSKNGHGRVVFLTPALQQQLEAYLASRPNAVTDHLFLAADGSPLSDAALRYRCHLWGTLAALSFSPHRLRHTFATRLLNRGLPLASIQRLLGHKTLSMTLRYAHLHDSTLLQHFEAATAYLEGIPIPDWPLHQHSASQTVPCPTHCN